MGKREPDVGKDRDLIWPDVRIRREHGQPFKADTNIPVGDWPGQRFAQFVCAEGATEEDAIAALRDAVAKAEVLAEDWRPPLTKVIRVQP